MAPLSLLLHLLLSILFLSIYSNTAATPPRRRQTTFLVTDYGAIGDGKHCNTPHIQAAIDACNAAGGGIVRFPLGDYLTGTVYLKSGVTLDVTENTNIFASTKLSDYPAESKKWYLVLAENVTNIGMMGGGTIDGQGPKFVEKIDKRVHVMVSWNKTGACTGDECRPRLLGFFDCRNVTVRDVTFREPAHWNVQIVRCDNTIVDDVALEGDFEIPKNQGLYIEDSNNTVIKKLFVDIGYHAISLKAYKGSVHNLTVTDSDLRTRSTAIKLESTGRFGFKDLLFDHIQIEDSHHGITLHGGNASNITFSNIQINTDYKYVSGWASWERAEPIYIKSCPWLEGHHLNSNVQGGAVNNIHFINISSHSEDGVFLSGSDESFLRNLKFSNVNLTYSIRPALNTLDKSIKCREGCRRGTAVCRNRAGMVMEYMDGLVIENVNMRWNNSINWKWWYTTLDFSPRTVNNITMLGFNSAHISHELETVV